MLLLETAHHHQCATCVKYEISCDFVKCCVHAKYIMCVYVFVCLIELSGVLLGMVFTASMCACSRTVSGVVGNGVHCKYVCVF